MRPDQSLFKGHLEEASFQMGVDRGQWGIVDAPDNISWPNVIIWCRAAPGDTGFEKYYFRFNLENYSASAPTAVPWDIDAQKPLAHEFWPAWSDRLRKVFNPRWNGGVCLYAPCDRLAMKGHPKWPEQYPTDYWTPDSTIVKYLRFLEKILRGGNE